MEETSTDKITEHLALTYSLDSDTPTGSDWEFQALIAHYAALRQEAASLVGSLVPLGALVMAGSTAALTIASQFRLDALSAIMPLTILLISVWAVNHLYSLFHLAAYLNVLERRINLLAGRPVMEWESGFSTARSKKIMTGGRVITGAAYSWSNRPQFMHQSLMIVWFFSVFGFALYSGHVTIHHLLSGWSEWAANILLAFYDAAHVLLALCLLGILVWWMPKYINRWESIWRARYEVNVQVIGGQGCK